MLIGYYKSKTAAFSYVELMVGLFILLLTVIPTLKLNANQIKTYIKIERAEEDLAFFEFLLRNLESKTYEDYTKVASTISIDNFQTYQNFTLIEKIYSMNEEKFLINDYKLNLYIKDIEVDYVINKKQGFLIEFDFSSKNLNKKGELIVFKK